MGAPASSTLDRRESRRRSGAGPSHSGPGRAARCRQDDGRPCAGPPDRGDVHRRGRAYRGARRKPIAAMFTEDGEDAFRALEREVVAEALAGARGVLALGGGSVLAASTRERLRGHRVVLLWVGLADGIRRTGMSTARPLLAGVNPRATFKALLDARAPLYREVATVEVDTSRRSANQVARAVLVEVAQAHPGALDDAVVRAALEPTPPHAHPARHDGRGPAGRAHAGRGYVAARSVRPPAPLISPDPDRCTRHRSRRVVPVRGACERIGVTVRRRTACRSRRGDRPHRGRRRSGLSGPGRPRGARPSRRHRGGAGAGRALVHQPALTRRRRGRTETARGVRRRWHTASRWARRGGGQVAGRRGLLLGGVRAGRAHPLRRGRRARRGSGDGSGGVRGRDMDARSQGRAASPPRF